MEQSLSLETIQPWIPLITSYALKTLGVIAIIGAAIIAAGRVKNVVIKGIAKAHLDSTLGKFAGNAARWMVLGIAMVFALGVFGVQTSSFAALIAAMGLAIGLAFQGTLSNFAAGVMLLVFRPFKVGQFVKVAGEAGVIDEISIFTTTMDTADNRRVILANTSIFGSTIENVSHHATRRCDVAIGTAYEADLKETKKVLQSVVDKTEKILSEPEVAIVLTNLGATCIDWSIRVYVKSEDYWEVREKILWECKYALDKAEIGIPYPQVDVHLQSLPAGSEKPTDPQ